MIFHNRKGRRTGWLRRGKEEKIKDFDPEMQWEQEEPIELEKNDFLAMVIAAIIVFGPIFLVLGAILMWSFTP